MNDLPDTAQTYRIGTVSRLTGISPDTLRVWERRYSVVAPVRSAGGGREYSRADIERLQLIKQLVDAGDAIGSIARLDTDALLARTAGEYSSAFQVEQAVKQPCRIIAVGDSLSAMLKADMATLEGVELVAAISRIDNESELKTAPTADVMVIEIATLHTDTTRQVIGWLEDMGIHKALVVYRFSTSEALQRLPAARIQTVRAPVSSLVVRNLCLGMRPQVLPKSSGTTNEHAGASLAVTPRLYSNETLAALAQVSPAMKCECPKHLAELITDLVAFERYSAECENRNTKDAAVHAYLHATASQARDLIEGALTHVIEVEGIDLRELTNAG